MAKNIEPTPQVELDRREKLGKDLLANPLWTEALDEIEKVYTDEWKNTEGPHADYRERAYFMVKCVDKLRSHINECAITTRLNPHRAKETMRSK